MDHLPTIRLRPDPLRQMLLLVLLAAGAAGGAWVAAAGAGATPALRAGAGLAALLAAVAAAQVWRQRGAALVLDAAGLRTDAGTLLAATGEILRVQTGGLSLAPPGGFALELRHPGRAAWVPGLGWRLGRRLGVGGLVPKAQARAAAELLRARLARG